jgi:hypothetical protein
MAFAMLRDGPATGEASAPPSSDRAGTGAPLDEAPRLVFQHVARDANYARVGLQGLHRPQAPRAFEALTCDRVYFAGGRGLCLISDQDVLNTSYKAKIFGPDFEVRHEVRLGGIPSRARVSPDGRYGATTVFVSGHSYSNSGFSTETVLVDLGSGRKLANLEDFEVMRDGERIESPDFNFWGVTFARDGNTFFATLATRGKTFLVEGDIRAGRVRVLRQNVECPSLSPDGTRIAYKKLVGESPQWRLHVLDLTTMEDTPLAESYPVDDQAEWLDDGRVLYGRDADVWVVPADGSGRARKFLSGALSPAVVP